MELNELNIIKEFLLDKIHQSIKNGEDECEKAYIGGVSKYVQNIISSKFADRENHLRSLLDEILQEIKKKSRA